MATFVLVVVAGAVGVAKVAKVVPGERGTLRLKQPQAINSFVTVSRSGWSLHASSAHFGTRPKDEPSHVWQNAIASAWRVVNALLQLLLAHSKAAVPAAKHASVTAAVPVGSFIALETE